MHFRLVSLVARPCDCLLDKCQLAPLQKFQFLVYRKKFWEWSLRPGVTNSTYAKYVQHNFTDLSRCISKIELSDMKRDNAIVDIILRSPCSNHDINLLIFVVEQNLVGIDAKVYAVAVQEYK